MDIGRMIKSRGVRQAVHVARMWRKLMFSILVGEPEGKIPIGRTRRWWVNNIKMELRGVGWGGMDWIDRDQWRDFVDKMTNLWVL
jgi:hypothetical protein